MQRVLILGAGINGAALARELVINGVSVCVVDTADVASGATACSSRLIHGGLRYLEHGELDLVRESLAERARLLRLAPHYVRPLELFIPLRSLFSGVWNAARRFFGWPAKSSSAGRGLWLVRVGLTVYDRFARDRTLPRHRTYAADDPHAPPVDHSRYRWQCSYHDAAILYPERFVIALLEDARQAAQRHGVEFRLLNYHRARLSGKTVEVLPVDAEESDPPVESFEPAAIINATGAWVDETLRQLEIPSRQLMGGTKGSHFVTSHAGLRQALAGRGVYAEAADGRPVFLLPLGENSLVGTTDIPFPADPATAVATDEEIEYLLDAANAVFADLRLTHDDVDWHYSGVRPLPYGDASMPGSITRRHWLEKNMDCAVPFYSVIGGKLTTCRSLAEEAADIVLKRLGRTRQSSTRERVIPGGEEYADDNQGQDRLAERFALSEETLQTTWQLYGTHTEAVLSECGKLAEPLGDSKFPAALARWVIENEWAGRLEDLICRRLMLLYDARLSLATVRHLAELLVDAGRLPEDQLDAAVDDVVQRLQQRHGKLVATEAPA